jgi:peptidoglycan/LPS O-acetylase OafA/YrhL
VLSPRDHNPWLDWLRFAAAAMVLVFHARGALLCAYGDLPVEDKGPAVAAAFAITRFGNEAVIVFFVLSGYFVAGRGAERLCRNRFDLADYAVDRLTRIYVPYLPVLFLSLGVAWVLGVTISAKVFASHVFGLQGITVNGLSFTHNGALWTLAYEIWFYFLLGSVAAFVRSVADRGWRLLLSSAALLTCAWAFVLLGPTYLFCWLIGGFAYFCRPRSVRLLPILGALAVALMGAAGNQLRTESVSVELSGWEAYLPQREAFQLMLAAGVGALMPQIAELRPRTAFISRIGRVGTGLAAFSYTLYLTHFPTLMLLKAWWGRRSELSPESVGGVVGGCLICLAVAWLVYLPFERQTPALRRMMRRKLKGDCREKAGTAKAEAAVTVA